MNDFIRMAAGRRAPIETPAPSDDDAEIEAWLQTKRAQHGSADGGAGAHQEPRLSQAEQMNRIIRRMAGR